MKITTETKICVSSLAFGLLWSWLYLDKASHDDPTMNAQISGVGESALEKLYPRALASVNLPTPSSTLSFHELIMRRKSESKWMPPRLEAAYILNVSPFIPTKDLEAKARLVSGTLLVIESSERAHFGSHSSVPEDPVFRWL